MHQSVKCHDSDFFRPNESPEIWHGLQLISGLSPINKCEVSDAEGVGVSA
jgi:hypothetical protein